MDARRHARPAPSTPPLLGRPGVGISLNAVINGTGFSIVLWGLIFKTLGLW